jgi:hypothetical protein
VLDEPVVLVVLDELVLDELVLGASVDVGIRVVVVVAGAGTNTLNK